MNLLTDRQTVLLTALYEDGAWTHDEVQTRLFRSEIDTFLDQGVLTTVRTEMGVMTLLGPPGRRLCLPAALYARSPARQLDHAYVRLCVRARGWRASDLPLTPYLDLRALRVGRLQRYETLHGPAVVTGKLTGGGYSLQTMTEIADLLRAPALAYRFHVIIFTPRARRGQALAERNTSFLQVVHKLPNEYPAQPHPPRIQRVAAVDPDSPLGHAGPAITPYIADERRALGVPDLTLQILQFTRAQRIEQARADLEVDGVMSAAQLARYYALNHDDLSGTPFVDEIVRPIHGRLNFESSQRFYCRSKAQARTSATGLGNRAGTGELRRQLGAPAYATTWLLEPRSKHRTYEPDATWLSPEGPVAVEYDSGSYNWTTIAFKVEKFRQKGLPNIVWGTPSELRGRRLKEQFGVDPLVCEWWSQGS